MSSLTFNLESIHGDVEFFVSSKVVQPTETNFDYASRRMDRFDSVTINQTPSKILNQVFYITIYANVYSIFSFNIRATYNANVD